MRLALEASLIRACLPDESLLHEQVVTVLPGMGPVIAYAKRAPASSARETGLQPSFHLLVPELSAPSRGCERQPFWGHYRVDGRDVVTRVGEAPMTPADIRALWAQLPQSYALARVLPVLRTVTLDGLALWAHAHDQAVIGVKGGRLPGAADLRREAPEIYRPAMAAADAFHLRAIAALEAALHELAPSCFPAGAGWLGVPEGVSASRVEQVPLEVLLRSAAVSLPERALAPDLDAGPGCP